MNKILGGTVNTTDNQVTAQVKAEPTVAKPATRTAAAEGEHKQTRRRTNTRRPAGEGRTRQHAAGEGESTTRQRRTNTRP
ncbi:Beta-lactamase protein, partial [human gut metagenome]